jgi:hypothetical protein
MIARLVRTSARRQKQHAAVAPEWRDLIAAMVEDRARRRRRHEVGTALLVCAVLVAVIAVLVTHAGAMLR